MKKNEIHDFSVPTRQSYTAILIITYRLYRVLIRQLLPLILIVLLQGKIATSQWFLGPVIIIAVLGAVYSVAAFFQYFFYLEKNKLVVKKGVFKKTTLEIPFDRIQSINFEQNLIHRLFSVVKLNMDTAGSKSDEIQLYALDRNIAQQLSDHILSSRKIVSNTTGETVISPEKRKVLFRLSLGQLLKVGFTENHIRSGFIIIFFFFYIYDSLEEIGFDLLEKGEEYAPALEQLAQSLTIVIIFFIIFAISALVISLARTILRFYDLHMYRKGEGFAIVSGLLNKKELAAKDEKIQLIKYSQNLLQSLSGIFELVMRQASSASISDARSIKVVGLSRTNIEQSKSYVLKENYEESRRLKMNKVEFYFLYRRLFYSILIYSILMLFSVYTSKYDVLVYSSLLFILALIASILSYKKRTYAIGSELVKLTGGVFGSMVKLVEAYKIQNTRILETPFQRRRGLVSLVLYTASGNIQIPDITRQTALDLNNYLIYKVENSKKAWM